MPDVASPLIDDILLTDIVARCRVLRWLPPTTARSMVLGWAEVFDKVLDKVKPDAILCWSLDRYISDVLAYLVEGRGGKLYELGVSPLPDAVMLMRRGALLTHDIPIDPVVLDNHIHTLTDSLFTPSYAVRRVPYTLSRWWRTFSYFKLRGLVFWIMSIFKRDPLNLHYVDSQSFLGHKPRVRDVRVLGMFDSDWQMQIERFSQARRLFLPLQLFPEASIDYWIRDLGLIEHEHLLVKVTTAFSKAGFIIVIKDHPLQFGFRQKELIDRLKVIQNVVFVPYDVSGNALLEQCDVIFTCTGTLGMQAALVGKVAITTPTYFTTSEDFVVLNTLVEVEELPARVDALLPVRDAALAERQRRIVGLLMKGSFSGDYYAFRTFNASNGTDTYSSDRLAEVVGAAMRRVD